jgi:hypothetical protein
MAAGSLTDPDWSNNTLEDITIALSTVVDDVLSQGRKTEMWTAPSELIQGFNKAKTGQVSSLITDGMGNANGNKGIPIGTSTFSWEDYTLNYDRGRAFRLKGIDVMKEADALTMTRVISNFTREAILPEQDALGVAAVTQRIISQQGTLSSHVGKGIEYAYTPAKASFVSKISDALDSVYNNSGYDEGCTIFVNGKYRSIINGSTEVTKTKDVSQVSGINTTVPMINGSNVVFVPEARMYAKYTLLDGVTDGQTLGGITPASSGGFKMSALITAPDTAYNITALNYLQIHNMGSIPGFAGSQVDFELYYDTLVMKNKIPNCYALVVDAES